MVSGWTAVALVAGVALAGCAPPPPDHLPVDDHGVALPIPGFLPNLPPDPDQLIRDVQIEAAAGDAVVRLFVHGAIRPDFGYRLAISGHPGPGFPYVIYEATFQSGGALTPSDSRRGDAIDCSNTCPEDHPFAPAEVTWGEDVLALRWQPEEAGFAQWDLRASASVFLQEPRCDLDNWWPQPTGNVQDEVASRRYLCPERLERMPGFGEPLFETAVLDVEDDAWFARDDLRIIHWAVTDDRILAEVHFPVPSRIDLATQSVFVEITLRDADGRSETYGLGAGRSWGDGQPESYPFSARRTIASDPYPFPEPIDSSGSFVEDGVVHLHAYRPDEARATAIGLSGHVRAAVVEAEQPGCLADRSGREGGPWPWTMRDC